MLKYIFLLAIYLNIFAQCSPGVYFGMMIHLEDEWQDSSNINAFNNHVNGLKLAVSFVKPYNARFTAEASYQFARACVKWNNNILQEMIDSSMGVGCHAGKSSYYKLAKNEVDKLVSPNMNLGVSGGMGPGDTLNTNNWVDSADVAGLKYVDGPTYFAYLQVPISDRPNNESDSLILNELYHDPVPPDFSERIFPHKVSSAFTWNKDTTGNILLLTGSLGEFTAISEGRSNCFPNCVLDSADVDTVINYVSLAIQLAKQKNKPAVVYMHTPLKLYKPQNKKFFDYLFQSLQQFVISGDLEYKTQLEIYQAINTCSNTSSILTHSSDNVKIITSGENIKIISKHKIHGIIITNILGETLYKTSVNSYKVSISNSFSPGVYFVEIINSKGIFVKKFLVN